MRINEIYHKLTHIGLKDDEGMLEHREVIMLNKILLVSQLFIIIYIFVELAIYGIELILFSIAMAIAFIVPLFLHKYRLFSISKYYVFLMILCFAVVGASLAGKDALNYVILISAVMFGIVLFKKPYQQIISVIMVICTYLLILYILANYQPFVEIEPEIIQLFRIIFFILAIIANFLLGYYFANVNTEYETIISKQKATLTEKNKEITDSITYAKRIQNAILPTKHVIQEHLPNSFFLYLPKDIVAGDFYWLEKTKDSVLFAAADCTGHGVPGAMVSVVCKNALNRSVREFGLTAPAKILDKTREIVSQEFGQSDYEINDGMDISLVALSSKMENQEQSVQLEYSGANNPLWIIRSDKNEIEIIKGDKQPVGIFSHTKSFTNHELTLKKGDLLYLFSDGLVDQFGGASGKKFKAAQLKKLILSIKDLPIGDQKNAIENAFNSWKGNVEQTDDVCMIGVRL